MAGKGLVSQVSGAGACGDRATRGRPLTSSPRAAAHPHRLGHLASGLSPSPLPELARVLDCGKETAQMRWAGSRQDLALACLTSAAAM